MRQPGLRKAHRVTPLSSCDNKTWIGNKMLILRYGSLKGYFTFNLTVFSSWDESVCVDIQAVHSAGVTIQRHHTPVCLQIPTPAGGKAQQKITQPIRPTSSLHHHCSSVIIIIVHLLLTWYWHRSWQLPAGVCPDRAAPPESCQHGPSSLRPLLSRTPRKEVAPRGLWSPWPSTTHLCSPSPDEGLPCQTQPDYITCVT